MRMAPDKWKHFYVGIAMGAVLQIFFSFFMRTHLVASIIFAFIFSSVIGYGFELFSKFTGIGHYDVMDAVAAVIGAVIGIGCVTFVYVLL